MKKLLASLLILLAFKSFSFGAWGDESFYYTSSYTVTNDTLASISSRTIPGGVFVGVVVSSPTIINSSVTFYNSNGVLTSTIGVVSLQGVGNGAFYIPFQVRISSGLTYTVTGNPVAGISIIYLNSRPQ